MIQRAPGMSLKLKMMLGSLVLLALFMGYRVAMQVTPDVASDPVGPDALTAAIGTIPAPDDTDHDGLMDDDETEYKTNYRNHDTDGDGYVDGEEVLSGYDPTKDQDDKLHGSKNLTDLFAKNLLAGIMAGDLDPTKKGEAAYEFGRGLLSYAVLTEANAIFAGDPAAEKIIVVPSTPEALTEYREFIDRTFGNPDFGRRHSSQVSSIANAMKLIRDGKEKEGYAILYGYQQLYEQKVLEMIHTPVPEPLAEMHRALGTGFSRLAKGYHELAKSVENGDVLMRDVSLKLIADTLSGMRQDLLAQLKKLATKS